MHIVDDFTGKESNGALYLFDEGTSIYARDRRENVPQFTREYGEFIGNP